MRSICLLGVQVAVEGKGWMVLAIDNYGYFFFFLITMVMVYFEHKGCLQRNLDLNCVS